MAMGFRIEYKPDALYEIRRMPGVIADLEDRAERIKAGAEGYGGEFVTYSQQGERNPQGRWRVSVTTADYKARAQNNNGHAGLLKALDYGR